MGKRAVGVKPCELKQLVQRTGGGMGGLSASMRLLPVGFTRLTGVALLMLGTAIACQLPVAPPEPTPPLKDPITDREGPALSTDPITMPQPSDLPIRFTASAVDPSGVYVVNLHYKPQNTDWQVVRMTPVSTSPDQFEATLTPDQFDGASSLSYYLEAADGTPYRSTSLSPTTGSSDPYKFNLSVAF